MDDDAAVEAIRHVNQPLVDEFQAWLQAKGITAKTLKSHRDNLLFFAEYLVYMEPFRPLDQANAEDVYDFLSDWFPRKAAWACTSNTQSYMASFRKFFTFLQESSRVDAETKAEVYVMLKENKEEFLDAVASEDEY